MATKKEMEQEAPQGTTPTDETAPAGPKMVKIRLFKDGEKYKNDVFVAVNGKRFLIKRGVDVEVPDYVAEVLEQSRKQDQNTADLIERKSGEYAAEAQRHGI